MTFELEISTMHKSIDDCKKMLDNANIHCNCIIINQCNENDYYEEVINDRLLRIYFTTERGLSKSRNMALANIKADIMAIGDDDLYYLDNFDKIIIDYYESVKNADMVLFNMDNYNKSYPNKGGKVSFLGLGKFCSMQVSFTKRLVLNSRIKFNELFGTGSNYFQSGEEQIFMSDCFRANQKIFYCPKKILKREKSESSWFKGFDERFIKDRGAIYYAISRFYYIPFVIRFAIKYRKKLKPISIFNAIKLMRDGRKEYINLLKEEKNGTN